MIQKQNLTNTVLRKWETQGLITSESHEILLGVLHDVNFLVHNVYSREMSLTSAQRFILGCIAIRASYVTILIGLIDRQMGGSNRNSIFIGKLLASVFKQIESILNTLDQDYPQYSNIRIRSKSPFFTEN